MLSMIVHYISAERLGKNANFIISLKIRTIS